MAIFEVYNLVQSGTSPKQDEARTIFLSDKVSILALIVPGLWLLWHALWYEFGIYMIFVLMLFGIGLTDYHLAVFALSFLPGLYLFLEGQNLIANKLGRKDYMLAGLVDAQKQEAAELKWFADSASKANQNETTKPSNFIHSHPARNLDEPEFGIFAPQS